MTDGGTGAIVAVIWKRLVTIQGAVALVGALALIIGFFIDSLVGRIVCISIGVAASVYWWRIIGEVFSRKKGSVSSEEVYSQSPEGDMKKLLFDDFQSSAAQYVVKEIEDGEAVVPSSKAVKPVAITGKEEKVDRFDIGDFFDLESDIFRNEAEPRSEFNFLMNKLLVAMKEVLFAHSVMFFWANREKLQMVLEAKATDSQNFMTGKRFPIENDIVSQVAKNGKPQVLGRVNPIAEKELLCHYQGPEYVKSLIVVPVYFMTGSEDQLPVGVIAADSKAEDAFGPETLGLMGKFTKVTSALIKSYTDKYDLLLDSELLTSIRRMQDRLKSEPNEKTVLDSLAEEANRLVSWDYLTVTMYSDEHNGWVIQKVVNRTGKPYPSAEFSIDFNDSLVGRVIRTNTLQNLGDLSLENVVRFQSGEKIESTGAFLCVPISSFNRCYGALSLESSNKFGFSGSEAEVMYRLVENAASSLEVLYMNDLVKDYVIVDHLTGTFTKKHFLKKLEEEVQRSEDYGTELALASIALDDRQELMGRYGKDGFDSLLGHTTKILRANIRPYDLIGRQDDDRIGVLLVNTPANEGYLWAEKVRKQIASQVITLNGRSFSVTVCIGVCGLMDGMHKEELLAGTSQVLHKAIESGGNLVRVF